MKRRALNWNSVRAVGVAFMLATPLALAAGCDGGGGGSGADARPDAGGAGGAGGGASGMPGSGGRPAIPAATFESCSDLALTFSDGGCNSGCANVRCDCDPFPSSYLACRPEQGCHLQRRRDGRALHDSRRLRQQHLHPRRAVELARHLQ